MTRRPNIPENIKLKLWVLSGGRCEFPGCNQYVWREGLTLKEDNFAHMAHIIAASSNGPRGNSLLSPEMAKDFDNLMLVCLDHSKLVDGSNSEGYSVEDLQKYKQAHENRIRIQTDLQPNVSTTVFRFIANIGERPVAIALKDTYQAILPRFPADDKGVLMDYTNRPGRGEVNFWESFFDEIGAQVHRELAPGNDRPRPSHISVFALGPIPLLIKLGHAIGNIIPADLFQKHRDTEDWKWKPESNEPFEYTIHEIDGSDNKNIVLILSLSGKIHYEEVYKNFEGKPHVYEISIETPNPGFLNQQSQLKKFREVYRKLLSQIRNHHGPDIMIHLFPAIPAPIAVLCGREILPKSDPKVIVYDHEKMKGGFISLLTIN